MHQLLENNYYDLVLVCGPYKTGTSLVTHLLEQKGYFNPAAVDNCNEHANGLSQRYMTKESSISRKLNTEILHSSHISNFDSPLSFSNLKHILRWPNFSAIQQFIFRLPPRSVIKDPQLTYTLFLWLEACKSLNKTVKVYFTSRHDIELVTAWNEAYFTKTLLTKNRAALTNMKAMAGSNRIICAKMHIPFEVIGLKELKTNFSLIN